MSEEIQIARCHSLVAQLERKIQSLTCDLKASNARMEAAQRQLSALTILEETAMNTQVRRRLSLETDMRRALEAGEFTVHYQPLVDIATRRVTSLEALLRWHHPTRGPISPGEFIPVAEESDLILSLGEHVLRTVCEQVVRWQKEGIAVVPVAVNISAIQLQRQPMWKFVRGILRETGMRPQLLALEITESSLIKDAQKHIKELHGLRRDGVHIEIDDFGTGYSSLSYLKRLPIDMLKIDRSFIGQIDTDAADEAIVSAILAMANSLGIKVVAEGVETQAQLDVLRYHGCETAQGFFFGRPLPAEQCRKLLYDVARRPAFTETLRLELVSGRLAKSLAVA